MAVASPVAPSKLLFPSKPSLAPLYRTRLLPSLIPLRNPQRLSLRTKLPRRYHLVTAQFNFFRVLQRAWRVGTDGIDAGAKFVPDVVPRPIAKIGVAAIVAFVSIFALRSVISTAFFALGMMGFIYFLYLAFSKDERPSSSERPASSQEETLEEARKIMEKYK